MANFSNVTVVMDRIPVIIEALREGAKVAVRQVAKEITDEANNSAPFDTGVLAASGYYVASDVSTYGQAVASATGIDQRDMLDEITPPESPTEAIIGYAASYAIFVHDGSRNVAGRPWLAQAAEGARERVTQKVADTIKKAVEGVSL